MRFLRFSIKKISLLAHLFLDLTGIGQSENVTSIRRSDTHDLVNGCTAWPRDQVKSCGNRGKSPITCISKFYNNEDFRQEVPVTRTRAVKKKRNIAQHLKFLPFQAHKAQGSGGTDKSTPLPSMRFYLQHLPRSMQYVFGNPLNQLQVPYYQTLGANGIMKNYPNPQQCPAVIIGGCVPMIPALPPVPTMASPCCTTCYPICPTESQVNPNLRKNFPDAQHIGPWPAVVFGGCPPFVQALPLCPPTSSPNCNLSVCYGPPLQQANNPYCCNCFLGAPPACPAILVGGCGPLIQPLPPQAIVLPPGYSAFSVNPPTQLATQAPTQLPTQPNSQNWSCQEPPPHPKPCPAILVGGPNPIGQARIPRTTMTSFSPYYPNPPAYPTTPRFRNISQDVKPGQWPAVMVGNCNPYTRNMYPYSTTMAYYPLYAEQISDGATNSPNWNYYQESQRRQPAVLIGEYGPLVQALSPFSTSIVPRNPPFPYIYPTAGPNNWNFYQQEGNPQYPAIFIDGAGPFIQAPPNLLDNGYTTSPPRAYIYPTSIKYQNYYKVAHPGAWPAGIDASSGEEKLFGGLPPTDTPYVPRPEPLDVIATTPDYRNHYQKTHHDMYPAGINALSGEENLFGTVPLTEQPVIMNKNCKEPQPAALLPSDITIQSPYIIARLMKANRSASSALGEEALLSHPVQWKIRPSPLHRLTNQLDPRQQINFQEPAFKSVSNLDSFSFNISVPYFRDYHTP